MGRLGFAAIVAAVTSLAAPLARAQQPDLWDWRSPFLTRVQLTQVLAHYEAAAASPAYSDAMRARAQADVDSIQGRLSNGDIRVGDRLRLHVEGQPTLSDTFAITAGPALILPVVGSVDLKGVLRSELPDRLTTRVEGVYRSAVVRVVFLTRIAVLGGVAKPGFYSLPSDALIADALTASGGIAPGAQLDDIYLERGRSRLVDADSLQFAMRRGETIGDLRLEDGDRIVVPLESAESPEVRVRTFSYLLSLPLTLYALIRLF